MSNRKLGIVALLLLAACGRGVVSKEEKLDALEQAYKIGVVGPVEYEIKKKALLEPPKAEPPQTKPAPAPAPKAAPPEIAKAPAPPPKQPKQPAAAPRTCPDPEPGGESKLSRVYPQSAAQVRQAAVKALRELEFTINTNTAIRIEAARKKNAAIVVGASGERIVLQFRQTGKGTTVSGETKKNFVGRLTQRSWTAAVLDRIACELR